MKLVLKPVTRENRKETEQLEVFSYQKDYIESVRECMDEADQLEAWHPVCIYDRETLIGLAMYGKIQEDAYTRLWFDRFLIEKDYQGKGYVSPAIRLVLDKIRLQYPDTHIYLRKLSGNCFV